MPTTYDVARAAGVSQMTVSRAFDPEAPIRDRTRRKILATAEEIGYVHNRSASDLASGRRRGIGMIVPTLQESIYLPVVDGARRAFDAEGASFFLQAIDYDRRKEMGALTTLLSLRVRAVLLPSIGHGAKEAAFIRRLAVPVIEAGNLPEQPIHAAVGHSDFKAGYVATRHLIAAGRTRVAMICGHPNQTSNSRDRLRGYRAALREAGLFADPGRIAFTDHSCAGAAHALARIEAGGTPFDSIVAAGELWSPPVLLSLLKSGRQVPDDVAVMGVGDVTLGPYFPVGLSVVALPRYESGRMAAELAMADPAGSRGQRIELPVTLTLRESA
ncbi:MAG: LacI family DNA-binding transcriptional regulator [Microvirga sp.]